MSVVQTGGDATTDVGTHQAYSRPAPSLELTLLSEFAVGNRIFNTSWVEAPSSVSHFDGLGPYYNRRSCSGCHTRDGRGRPPETPDADNLSAVIRLRHELSGRPDPRYGAQLGETAISGVVPEGRLELGWRSHNTRLDGEWVELRQPEIQIRDLGYGPLDSRTRPSLRIAPAVFGVGLLEGIPSSDLDSAADPLDEDGDGISGRVRRTVDPETGRPAIGRFGWKASEPTVPAQVTSALVQDMGLTSSIHPVEERPEPKLGMPDITIDSMEVSPRQLEAIVRYCRTLAVPARRNVADPKVLAGALHFKEFGCVSCHTPTQTTYPAIPGAKSPQTIHPFTDLLLHDMGVDLASTPEGDAEASEWRTPPLWGLGLAETVNGYRFLLHDGRARTLRDAILWHGGEAESAREAYRSASRESRESLHAFLESL